MQKHLSMLGFFFVYLYIQRVFWGNRLLPRYPPQDAAPCKGIMHLSWAGSCPSTLPILEQADRKQRRKLDFEGFFCSFSLLALATLHGLVLQQPKHLPCSTCFCWSWDKLQGTQMVGAYICKCMVACVHECSHAWVWCAPGCLLPVLGGGRGHSGAWLCVLAENGGIQKL